MKNTNKGFTLVELIVVITILAILGTIAFISLQGYSQDAKNSKVLNDVRSIVTAVEVKLTEGSVSMANVVDGNTLSDPADNGVTWTFGSGSILGTDGTYSVGGVNFTGLRQNGADFSDSEGNPYIAAVAINGTDNSFYQVVGQTKNADATYTAVLKGNYVQVAGTDAIGLVSETAETTGVVNSELLSTVGLY